MRQPGCISALQSALVPAQLARPAPATPAAPRAGRTPAPGYNGNRMARRPPSAMRRICQLTPRRQFRQTPSTSGASNTATPEICRAALHNCLPKRLPAAPPRRAPPKIPSRFHCLLQIQIEVQGCGNFDQPTSLGFMGRLLEFYKRSPSMSSGEANGHIAYIDIRPCSIGTATGSRQAHTDMTCRAGSTERGKRIKSEVGKNRLFAVRRRSTDEGRFLTL